MKIQLSDKRIIKGAMTVWSQPGPEVDIVMDLSKLTFRPGSITEIFAIHVVDHLFPEESQAALKNWLECLAPGGSLHAVNDDFEYIARGFVGGDISIDLLNEQHNHPCQCTRDNVVKMMANAGFVNDKIHIWLEGAPGEYPKKHYEFTLTAKK